MTALQFEWPYKVFIISQILLVALSKCTRIQKKLAIGVVMAFGFAITQISYLVVCIFYDLVNLPS